jgi:hypothetical protein
MATTKYIVDNAPDQTINGNLNITGTTNIKPYKVYTALLTQSGGDDPQSIYEGELTIGVTYFINGSAILDGCDFTNVGAPNNNVGTYFVATGTTPNWNGTTNPDMLIYNTGAPVVTVLENTIGNIWFTYGDVGQYLALSNGAFPLDKTGCFIGGTGIQSNCPSFVANSLPNFHPNAGNGVYIQCSGVEFTPDYYTDDALGNTMLEIRVYN